MQSALPDVLLKIGRVDFGSQPGGFEIVAFFRRNNS